MAFVLTIAKGKGLGERFRFDTGNVTIGRGIGNDVVLNDAGVSRTHARIQQQGAGFLLFDEGSANGTELNGVGIARPAALTAGDRIGVGTVVFEFTARVAASGRLASRPPWARIGAGVMAALLVIGFARLLVLHRETKGLAGASTSEAVAAQNHKERDSAVGRVPMDLAAVTPGNPKRAREAYGRGRRKLEERRVAPRNLYDALNFFIAARRDLEGLSPRPALYEEVAQLIKDCERDLSKDCSRMLFTAARFEKYEQEEQAQQTYREVLLRFPGEEASGCRKKAQGNLVSAQAESSE